MRLKLLSAIASLLILSVTVGSCLGNNDPVDYPVDATIWEFGLDTIYKGVYYKFTIDQIGDGKVGYIYNIDSVPHTADTIINKILVKTLTAPYGYVTSADTLFGRDSIDFSNTMYEPIKLKVTSLIDPEVTREYQVSVRIHKQDPDSLQWYKTADNFTTSSAANQKIVTLDNQLLIYTSNTDVYQSTITTGTTWSHATVTGLPGDLKLSSILNYKNTLYALAGNKVYVSEDGLEWTGNDALGENVQELIAIFPDENTGIEAFAGIAGIIKDETKEIFAVTNADATAWIPGEEVPVEFPRENISSTFYKTRTGRVRSIATGKVPNATQTVIWSSEDGLRWADIPTNTEFRLPVMEKPTVIGYNDQLYAYGADFTKIYQSVDGGLVWMPIEKKFMFPVEFKGRGNYSTIVDQNKFIWMVWTARAGSYGNEVWKGRLNKLGFAIQ